MNLQAVINDTALKMTSLEGKVTPLFSNNGFSSYFHMQDQHPAELLLPNSAELRLLLLIRSAPDYGLHVSHRKRQAEVARQRQERKVALRPSGEDQQVEHLLTENIPSDKVLKRNGEH